MANIVMFDIPNSLGAETLATAIILGITAAISVILRTWVRICNGAIGTDDYSMMIALVLFIVCCIFASLSCLSGLGAKDVDIQSIDPSGDLSRNALKWYFFFQATYLLCFPFIKISVCVALLRITNAKRYVIPLWSIIVVSVFMSLLGFVAVMVQCKPIGANWNPSVGHCSGSIHGTRVAFTVSATAIFSDWLCAIIPGFILWNLNMRLKVKVSLVFILALGVLASISTCIRIPYIELYSNTFRQPADGLYKTCNIAVWSVVECGIGIIAGSLPQLQPLFRRFGFGVNSTGRKLTGRNHLTENPALADLHYKRIIPTAPGAARQPIRLDKMPSVNRGHSLTTTCEGGGQQSQQWWDRNSPCDERSGRGLVIVKNTRIDIKYDSARPGSEVWR
ncbi:hypothetical protein F4677DRAFT_465274 [Hypoxylon crocopeplum]|nr:hypothetical protein F4677DRAFT_465274 [Hypoxylon crocopeplum]